MDRNFEKLEPCHISIKLIKSFMNMGKAEHILVKLSKHEFLEQNFLSKHNLLWEGCTEKEHELSKEELLEKLVDMRNCLREINEKMWDAIGVLNPE